MFHTTIRGSQNLLIFYFGNNYPDGREEIMLFKYILQHLASKILYTLINSFKIIHLDPHLKRKSSSANVIRKYHFADYPLEDSSVLMVEVVCPSKTLVLIYQTMQNQVTDY
jgi:hypothetical protein